MLDKLEYLDDGETRYPMAFTLNVMELVEEEYGGIEAWTKLIDKGEPSYKALKFMILEIINEGIDIQNDSQLCAAGGRISGAVNRKNQGEMRSAPSEQGDYDFDRVRRTPLTSKQVGRLITRIGFEECGMKIFKLIQESLPKGDNAKNVISTKSQK